MKPYIVFASCALISAIGGWLLLFSHGKTENAVGCFLLVIFGLGAITLPMLVGQSRRGGRGDDSTD